MKTKTTYPGSNLNRRLRFLCGAKPRGGVRARSSLVVAGLALLALAVLTLSAEAQTVRFRAGRVGITVPPNYTGSFVISNWVTVGGLVSPVNFDISGLPSGATYTLTEPGGQPLPSTMVTTGLLATVSLANVAEGYYTFSLNASGGAVNNILFWIQVGRIWSGGAGAANTNWTTGANWQGGVPGVNKDAIFSDAGAQSAVITNVSIEASTSVGSLRFSQTNNTSYIHTILVNPGVTLSVLGTGGFSFLRDYIGSVLYSSVHPKLTANFTGQSGTLVVNNEAANIALLGSDNCSGQDVTLDLSGLGAFNADVNRIGLGDYQLWPNFDNLSSSNLYNGLPSKLHTTLTLARTNVIKAVYADPNNYNVSSKRDYSLTLGNNERGGSSSTPLYLINLGITNAFFLDSLCITHASMSGNMQFNSAFTASNALAVFRSPSGGRMSMWTESDMGQGTAAMVSGSNDKTTVNFGGGTVDALVDRFYLSRDRINSSGQNSQSTLLMGAGTFDVNNAILGYQGEGNHTNLAYCEGTLILTNTAVFKVNNELIMGYTTADPADPTGNEDTGANGTWGKINLGPGGTLMANTISCGGVTKTSTNNASMWIQMTGGAKLVLTNTLGSTDARLKLLSLTNASGLTFSISGTGTKVFVMNLATSGSGANANVINVSSVSGVGAYPVTIPIISYLNPSTAAFVVGTLPSGVVGSAINNTANSTIDLTLNTNTPQILVWRGTVNGIWDTTTSNWVTQVGLNQTRWVDNDFAVFDDTATGSTTITVGADVVPGQSPATAGVFVNTTNLSYTFNGPNTIRGGATLQKSGSTTLTINGVTENSVILYQGALAGGGTVGATVAQYGTTLTGFSGMINGGLDASNATVSIPSLGSIAGPVILRAGSMLNNGTISGTLALQPSTTFDNEGTINVAVPWSVPTNSTVINNGTIVQSGPAGGNQGLTVNGGGALMGVGKITTPGNIALSDARVTIGSGGQLIIGNGPNEITNVTIATRLDFVGGSTTTFDVNPAVGNDVIKLTDGFVVGKVNFGLNNQLGGTLDINHVGGPAFTPATVLYLFDVTANAPDNSIPAIPGITPAPGPGLVWDYSNMLTNLTLKVASGLPTMTTAITATNMAMSWPAFYTGWHLQVQTNNPPIGLSTNWSVVSGSWQTNALTVAIVSTNGSVFYRLVYP